ncbi:MAG: hypothetical protein QOI78_4478, partial [Actinomycetota bacterium]|nr:hypothetical protein [Actinomycetota bacterium]
MPKSSVGGSGGVPRGKRTAESRVPENADPAAAGGRVAGRRSDPAQVGAGVAGAESGVAGRGVGGRARGAARFEGDVATGESGAVVRESGVAGRGAVGRGTEPARSGAGAGRRESEVAGVGIGGGGVAVAAPPVLMRPLPPPKSAVVPLPPAVLPAAGVAGVVGALLLPVDRPGVGWLLTGVAVAGAVVVADRRAREGQKGALAWVNAGWAILSLALLSMGAIRASGWLFVLCVLAAVFTGSLAVVGKRTVHTVLYDMFAVPFEALRAIPWAGRGVGKFTARRDGVARRIALAVLAAAVLVAVFVPLLASADP